MLKWASLPLSRSGKSHPVICKAPVAPKDYTAHDNDLVNVNVRVRKQALLNLCCTCAFSSPLLLSDSLSSTREPISQLSHSQAFFFLSMFQQHKQWFIFKQHLHPGIRKNNFTTLIEAYKWLFIFSIQITSSNHNQLNPSADCSLSARKNGNVWNQ